MIDNRGPRIRRRNPLLVTWFNDEIAREVGKKGVSNKVRRELLEEFGQPEGGVVDLFLRGKLGVADVDRAFTKEE